ncbi:MAG: HEPN domain-containing protein [Elusimicrobiota bacterium]
MNNEDVNLLLKKAEEDIKAADSLLQLGHYRISVSRSYYAMFYIAEGLLLTKGLSYSSHYAVILFFNKEFIKTGIFDKKYYNWLEKAFKLRQNGDYDTEPIITEEQSIDLIQNAKEFLEAAKKYLNI